MLKNESKTSDATEGWETDTGWVLKIILEKEKME